MHSIFNSTEIVIIFFGSTLKLENQFLNNQKNMFSIYRQFRYNGNIPCAILTKLRVTVKVASRTAIDF